VTVGDCGIGVASLLTGVGEEAEASGVAEAADIEVDTGIVDGSDGSAGNCPVHPTIANIMSRVINIIQFER
jgi:hypothetical protein